MGYLGATIKTRGKAAVMEFLAAPSRKAKRHNHVMSSYTVVAASGTKQASKVAGYAYLGYSQARGEAALMEF